jgi:hypothetical protein
MIDLIRTSTRSVHPAAAGNAVRYNGRSAADEGGDEKERRRKTGAAGENQ